MKNEHLLIRSASQPVTLLIAAAVSLCAGALVYLLARPVAPALISELLTGLPAAALQNPHFLPFADQLPSFFHMLAMLLATLAVTPNQRRLRAGALVVSVALGLAMEFVQHPAVLGSVGACAKSAFCGWLPGLESYARRGTFDPLDLAAIACAVIATSLCFTLSSLCKNSTGHNKDLTQ